MAIFYQKIGDMQLSHALQCEAIQDSVNDTFGTYGIRQSYGIEIAIFLKEISSFTKPITLHIFEILTPSKSPRRSW